MPYVILDLEFNNMQGVGDNLNAFLTRDRERLRHLYPNEIIQIGAVRLDDDLNETGRLNLFVRNVLYKSLNPFIIEMTGVSEEQLKEGIPYTEAVTELSRFSEGAHLVTWGIGDILELIRNCHMHSMPITVVGEDYLDLQAFVGTKDFENRSPSLKNALTHYDIECDDECLHDGLYDSICTAEVLKAALSRYGDEMSWKSSRILFSSDSIYITDIKVRDIPDSQITLRCPLCQGHIVYDVSMNIDHGRIKSMYHCEECNASFNEDISVKENMIGERKYFKKIKKIPGQYFRLRVRQIQQSSKNKYY